jgi:manganese/zinc/iron transport system permease protein
MVETLQKSRHVKEDAAIGLVFPAFFSLGTILATLYVKNIHLDIDRVLLGNAELIPIDRVTAFGTKLPRAMLVLGSVFTINMFIIILFYKEIALSVFDAGLAAALGFAPALMHYGLMAMVSFTTVAAFDAVGPVLVLAFFAVPAATARFLTNRFSGLLVLSVALAVLAAVVGTWIAYRIDTTIAGTVATLMGVLFLLVYLFSPRDGLVAAVLRRARQKRAFYETLLLVHLRTHEGTDDEAEETGRATMPGHLGWRKIDADAVAMRLQRGGFVKLGDHRWQLTETGRTRAAEALP